MSIFRHMIKVVKNMRANTNEITQPDERLKEYQRQQDRLKALTSNNEKMKSVSADIMIKNLLKQNLLKPNMTPTGNTSFGNKINSGMDLPNWLECDSSAVPALYKSLWSLVKTANNFADTHKVSQLLLTSGLQTEVLGFIWNLSNKQVPGQLSKQEFYIVLTLVGLAQTGYTFTNLSILNSIKTAPVPVLQTKVLEKCAIASCATSNAYSSNDFSQMKSSNEDVLKLTSLETATNKCNDFSVMTNTSLTNATNSNENYSLKESVELKSEKRLSKFCHPKELLDLNYSNTDCTKTSNFPLIGSSPTAELEDDEFSEFHSVFINESATDTKSCKDDPTISCHSDDFTDFQCAEINVDPLQTVIIGQKKEIPRIPLPKSLNGKLTSLKTNILKISPESEKKLKVLSQSETLSTLPESRISANNKVSKMPNIPVVGGGSRDIGMRLANHSLGSSSEVMKNQKCLKHKQPYSVEIPFSHKYGSIDDLFPKCFQKSANCSKTFVLKETKIRTVETVKTEFPAKLDTEVNLETLPSAKNTRKIEIPVLGTFNETTLPTQCEESAQKEQTIELFSTVEDKYSALREIELEMKQVQNTANMPNSDGNDEFGEFFSADLSFESPAGDNDLWGEWNILEATNIDDKKHLENINDVRPEVSKPCEKINSNQNSFSFDLLNLNEEKGEDTMSNIQHEISNSDKLEENDISLISISESDVKENKLPFERDKDYQDFITLDDVQHDKNNYFIEDSLNKNICESNFGATEQDIGKLLTSNLNSSDAEALQKCDSLPSLDLKMTAVERNDQEIIRKKCLLTCLNLMQQALEIFNRVSSTAVLAEVFSTQEAINYLNCLNIVCHISRRICINCSEISSVQEEIEKIWQKLITYCYEFGISLKEDVDSCMQMGIQCNLCLGFVGNDVIDQGLTSYHPSCANLWVNCIDSILPCPV